MNKPTIATIIPKTISKVLFIYQYVSDMHPLQSKSGLQTPLTILDIGCKVLFNYQYASVAKQIGVTNPAYHLGYRLS